MTKKKNKKAFGLIALVLVLGIVCAAYFVIKKLDLNAEEQPESNIITVQSYSASNLMEFSFVGTDGKTLTFERESEYSWLYPADGKFPVNSEEVENVATSNLTMLATRELEEESAEFGFDEPRQKITYKFDSGEEGETVREYTVGAKNTFNGGTYVRDETNGKIYIVSGDPASAFEKKLEDFILLDIAAYTVDPTSTKCVTINDGLGNSIEITDTTGIEDFLGEPFNVIDCSDWVEYGADESVMLKYGIDKSEAKGGVKVDYKTTVTVEDDNGESSAIRQDTTYYTWFGDRLEDGSIYYTISDSAIVYKLSAENLKTVTDWLDYVPAPETETSTDTVTE